MTDEILSLVHSVTDSLGRENRLLMQGRVNDALRQSEGRAAKLTQLERLLEEQSIALSPAARPSIERMLMLNQHNAALLQAALAGYVAGRDMAREHAGAAAYDASGRRVFPVSPKTKKHV